MTPFPTFLLATVALAVITAATLEWFCRGGR